MYISHTKRKHHKIFFLLDGKVDNCGVLLKHKVVFVESLKKRSSPVIVQKKYDKHRFTYYIKLYTPYNHAAVKHTHTHTQVPTNISHKNQSQINLLLKKKQAKQA
jgi:hypothetical protein